MVDFGRRCGDRFRSHGGWLRQQISDPESLTIYEVCTVPPVFPREDVEQPAGSLSTDPIGSDLTFSYCSTVSLSDLRPRVRRSSPRHPSTPTRAPALVDDGQRWCIVLGKPSGCRPEEPIAGSCDRAIWPPLRGLPALECRGQPLFMCADDCGRAQSRWSFCSGGAGSRLGRPLLVVLAAFRLPAGTTGVDPAADRSTAACALTARKAGPRPPSPRRLRGKKSRARQPRVGCRRFRRRTSGGSRSSGCRPRPRRRPCLSPGSRLPMVARWLLTTRSPLTLGLKGRLGPTPVMPRWNRSGPRGGAATQKRHAASRGCVVPEYSGRRAGGRHFSLRARARHCARLCRFLTDRQWIAAVVRR